jgi:hypothetical protein
MAELPIGKIAFAGLLEKVRIDFCHQVMDGAHAGHRAIRIAGRCSTAGVE